MTFIEYIKLANRHKILIIIITLIALISGSFLAGNSSNRTFNNTIFYIFAVQDPSHQTDSFENLQAADQITESIQGWFKDPAFIDKINSESNLNLGLKVKKQEKNNLIVTYSSNSITDGKAYEIILNSLFKQKIDQYNAKSDLQITISSNELNVAEKSSDLGLILMISLIVGLFFGYLGAYFYEYYDYRLKSIAQILDILQVDVNFHFKNHKTLKTNHQFLTRHIQDSIGENKLQILDLTSKSKVGIEVISKHTNIGAIKSLDLPNDLEKVDPNTETLFILELGHTSLVYLKQLKTLKFTKIEVILLDQI